MGTSIILADKDILITCVDGIKWVPYASGNVFHTIQIQFFIVDLVRNAMRYVIKKDYKAVSADLK